MRNAAYMAIPVFVIAAVATVIIENSVRRLRGSSQRARTLICFRERCPTAWRFFHRRLR